jgi:hypothetical protein
MRKRLLPERNLFDLQFTLLSLGEGGRECSFYSFITVQVSIFDAGLLKRNGIITEQVTHFHC